ncbi:DUF350 domain-containing protein [Brevibacterium daeguense]|uniref:DUF350 domain-containing protein n=1 Tax=Brevibacterium daeguense TaxID=909936 RepID=A0ABP8EKT7_9MICO|nr:DUF350 domain-containing protein [Brevibacterium daeguense]
MFTALLIESGIVLAFAFSGLLLMLVGYGVVDLITPGKLHELLWKEKSRNAAILVASNLLGVSIIVAAAIRASAADLFWGIVSTIVYGLVGIIVMALSFLIVDALTPGRLGDLVHAENIHPAVWVNASTHIGIAIIMASALL